MTPDHLVTKHGERGHRELLDFVEQYIDDQDSGIKALLAFFLNLVMEYEAEKQAEVGISTITDSVRKVL